jgi:hypothetical protein
MKLEPLGYHRRVADTLVYREKDLWGWFQSDKFADQYQREAQLRLSKSAIQLGRDANANNARRYELAEVARDKLGLAADIVLYQSQDSGGAPNAMLHYIPGQITVEFAGRVLELLDEDELLDLLGHEIAHYKLYQDDGGRHHTAVRLVHWICRREDCPSTWLETARRLSLYTEVYCDTAGYIVTGNRDVSIRGLAKIIADFKDADAKTYLAQAETILAQEKTGSQGLSHPELYIRAKAIANREALDEQAFEASLVPLIEGPLDIDALDVLGQETLEELSRSLIDLFTRPEVNRTDAVMAHARQFFPKFRWPTKTSNTTIALPDVTPQTRDYLAYVLLDLAHCDQTRAEDALATALVIARQSGLDAAFRKIARKELKKTTDEMVKFERHGLTVLGGAADA